MAAGGGEVGHAEAPVAVLAHEGDPAHARLVAGHPLGELRAQIQAGLQKLSPELREAVILRDLQGLEYVEIRTVLGVPEGTVKSRINRGRIELAERPDRAVHDD